MNKSVLSRLVPASFIVLFLFSFSAYAKEYRLTILHTNDHHGHFQKFSPYPVSDVGGLAAQSTLVNIVRSEVEEDGGHVLLLSAGDVNTGVPESDLLDAEPDFKLMNMIGYDAMALGNHEFDNSREVLLKQREWASFSFLGANIVKKEDGKPLVEPYIIKEIDGLNVAILGLITGEVPVLVFPDNVKDLVFEDPIETAKKYVPELRERADLIVVLSHLGLYPKESDRAGDIQLAEAVSGIDVIVGGHTHTSVEEPIAVGKTLIVQADGYSEHVGRLNLVIDSDADVVTASSYSLLPVNGKKRVKYNDKKYYQYVGTGYLEDQEILDAEAPYLEGANEMLSQPVGKALVELVGGKTSSRSGETNLGNMIADAMRQKTGADVALQNRGGIRAGIAPGNITYRDILTVQPFGNTLTEVMVTGAQLKEVLDISASNIGGGGFMQVSGLQVTYNAASKTAENILVNGEPLDLARTYKMVTNNFTAAGGDGYGVLTPLPQYDTGYVDADATMEYIQSSGEVKPAVEGRITVIQ